MGHFQPLAQGWVIPANAGTQYLAAGLDTGVGGNAE